MHVKNGLPVFRLPYPGLGVSVQYAQLHGNIDNVPVKLLPATPEIKPVVVIPDDIITDDDEESEEEKQPEKKPEKKPEKIDSDDDDDNISGLTDTDL